MTAQELFRPLHHQVQTAGRLHAARSRNHGHNHQHYINGRSRRRQTESKNKNGQAQAAQHAQANTAQTGTHHYGCKHEKQL